MKYKISSIKKKAKRMGGAYLDDCRLLADRWDEKAGIAEFSDEALAEIKATWEPKQSNTHTRICRSCRGF